MNSQRETVFLAFKIEEGGHGPRNIDASRSWKWQRSKMSSKASRKEHGPASILILAQ